MSFEINKPLHDLLSASVTAHVHEYNSVDPTNIIEADKDAKVHVIWNLSGPLAPFVAGTWYVSIFMERMGPGADLRVPLTPGLAIPLDPDTGINHYEAWVDIPANTVVITKDEGTVPFRLVATVAYRTPKGRPGPMAGFVEMAPVQFYIDDIN